MNNNTFIAIIPARYASTRFPGKPLAKLGGMTVIERVYRQVSQAIDDVLVATDDRRIADEVQAFGGRAVMTGTHHNSGTERCHEALQLHHHPFDIVINVQGDEPFIQPQQLRALMACFDDPATQIATLVKPFAHDGTIEQLRNPNVPKVVISPTMQALYFSRSVIPYLRGVEPQQWPTRHQFYTHIGLYAYRAEVLDRIVKLPPTPLEQAESLEQLRWLAAGCKISVALTDIQTIGIDTPQDLERAQQYLNRNSHA